MGESKSDGVLTKILIGAGTTIVTAIILSRLNLKPSGEPIHLGSPPPHVQNVQPTDSAELRQKQAELERKIAELSNAKKETVQTGIAEIESRRQEAAKTAPAEPESSNIEGSWYAPSTGSAYTIAQEGSLVTIQEYTAQVVTAYAQGTLKGRRVDFDFYSTVLGIRGKGWIEISPDRRKGTITVVNPLTGDRVTNDLQPLASNY